MRLIPIIGTFFLLVSCGGIRQKGHEVITMAKTRVEAKKTGLLEKIQPDFNAYTPDTKANKKRFREFFGFTPGPDVSSLYCLNDDMFLAATYYFAFRCQDSTSKKIIDTKHLRQITDLRYFGGGMFLAPLPWWDTTTLQTIKPFAKVVDSENVHWYFWYDRATARAFFFTYTM